MIKDPFFIHEKSRNQIYKFAGNIYFNKATDPFQAKLVEMKLDKKGNNLPGWIRLKYVDDEGFSQRYFGKYDTEKSILINCCY